MTSDEEGREREEERPGGRTAWAERRLTALSNPSPQSQSVAYWTYMSHFSQEELPKKLFNLNAKQEPISFEMENRASPRLKYFPGGTPR